MTEPRRVLIDWDYGAHGIWWVLTKEEKEVRPRKDGGSASNRLDGSIVPGRGASG